MTYNIIQTGSSGNAVLINDSILIDCGVAFKKLEPYIKDLRLVLLTHSHGDHFKASTVQKLHKLRPILRFGCCEWMVGPLLDAGVDKRVIDVMSPSSGGVGLALYYPDLVCARPEKIPHNAPNCAWHMLFPNDEICLYATDTSTLEGVSAKNYSYYLIESNHTRAEIEARIAAKRAAGEYAYETEAVHNHLSEEQALDWLAANMGPNSEYVFLHQHQDKEKINAE